MAALMNVWCFHVHECMETKEAMTIKGVSFLLLKGSILQHINTVTAQNDILRFTELIESQNQGINYDWLC